MFGGKYQELTRKMITNMLDNWPLKKQLGYYSYLPIFFLMGACMEFTMIHLSINGVNFYSVYQRKEQERLEEEIQRLEKKLDAKRTQLIQQGKQQEQSSKPVA